MTAIRIPPEPPRPCPPREPGSHTRVTECVPRAENLPALPALCVA